jgi:hypothetical protein
LLKSKLLRTNDPRRASFRRVNCGEPGKNAVKYSVLSHCLGKKSRGSCKLGAKNMPEALRNQLSLEHLQKDSVVK